MSTIAAICVLVAWVAGWQAVADLADGRAYIP